MTDKKKKIRKAPKKKVQRVKKISSVLDKVILPITFTNYRKKCCVNEEKEKENVSLTNKLLMELLKGNQTEGSRWQRKETTEPFIKATLPSVKESVDKSTETQSQIPREKQYGFKERMYFQEKKRELDKPVFSSEETSDAFSTKLSRRKKFKAIRKQTQPESETEIEGYIPVKVPDYAFGKANIPSDKTNIPIEKPVDEPLSLPIDIPQIPLETPDTDGLGGALGEPKIIKTGEKKKIRIKKPRPKLDIEEIPPPPPIPKKKKPLSKMNKSQLQDEYRKQFNEEPNKSFSKKDLYDILR